VQGPDRLSLLFLAEVVLVKVEHRELALDL
jgi:hypothetical protein